MTSEEHNAPPDESNEIVPAFATLHCSLGFESKKRGNLAYIDDHRLVFSVGNAAQVLDLNDMSQHFVTGITECGIGAISVHPNRSCFAVAGRGSKKKSPEIHIIDTNTLKTIHILRGGTTFGYSTISFDPSGARLASVGSDPDYTLVVWNWEQQTIVLRSKAFSQDVYRVYFSPMHEGRLITSGVGHIKFWGMAKTFTGLKLQGEIGKFGKSELSDISCFVELSDGKVISGTESGCMLLWDEIAIKKEIYRKNRVGCHLGNIEVIFRYNEQIVTGGYDGYIRVWNVEALDRASAAEESSVLEIEPVTEIHIGQNVHIHNIVEGKDHWIIQDSAGSLWKLNDLNNSTAAVRVFSFHSGGIEGVACSPLRHIAVTTGRDGSVRVYDYAESKLLETNEGTHNGTAICYAPLMADPTGSTFAVGYGNGVVKIFSYTRSGLQQLKMFRPHKDEITHITYSPDGAWLATSAKDNLLFFVNVRNNYSPLGFTRLDSHALSMSWDVSSQNIIFCTEDGQILHMREPSNCTPASSSSYVLENVKLTQHPFKRKKPDPPAPVAQTAQPADGETDPSLEAGVGDSAAAAGIDGDYEDSAKNSTRSTMMDTASLADAGEAGAVSTEPAVTGESIETEEGAEGIEEGEEVIEEGRPHRVLYKEGFAMENRYYVTCTGQDSGILFFCSPDTAEPTEELPSHGGVCRYVQFSHRKNYLLSGGADGSVLIRRSDDLQTPYKISMHSKGITGVVTSFDESYVLSTCSGGNLFVHRIVENQIQNSQVDLTQLVLEEEMHVEEKEELEDMSSIEEQKLRREQNKIAQAAEEKKTSVKRQVARIAADYQAFVQRNAKLHPDEQLPKEMLSIDPYLKETMKEELEKKKEKAIAEMEWISEYKERQIQKLNARYFDRVAVERIVMNGFHSVHTLSTFPLRNMPESLLAQIKMVHAQIEREQSVERMESSKSPEDFKSNRNVVKRRSDEVKGDQPVLRTEKKLAKSSPSTKLEEKKAKRKQRAAEWIKFFETKPDEEEDAGDLEKIKKAEKYMGDYPLKLGNTYRVPENRRINTERKFFQKILLEESIYNIKLEFNSRILVLRDIKVKIIEWIQRMNLRIREINRELHVEEELYEPKLVPRERPEDRTVVTPEDVEKFIRDSTKPTHSNITIMNNRSTSGEIPEPEPIPSEVLMNNKKPVGGRQNQTPSQLELEEKQNTNRMLQWEKTTIVEKINLTLATFDRELESLRREKLKAEADLKVLDLKMLVLHQELELLKEFEKEDINLAEKLQTKRNERQTFATLVAESQTKLEARNKELEKKSGEIEEVNRKLNSIIGDGNPFADYLKKLYNKNIKRTKKQAVEEDFYNSDDERGEGYDFDNEEEDNEGDEEQKPADLDEATYESVLELRDQRLQLEEVKADMKKALDMFRKELETTIKKEKVVANALTATENELQELQKNKQDKLNEITVVLSLKLSQYRFLNGTSLIDSLVFTNEEFDKLNKRIIQSEQELVDLNNQLKSLQKDIVNIGKEKVAKKNRNKQLETKAIEVQMLKFGQVINLEALEKKSVNRPAEELKEKMTKEERKRNKDLELLDEQTESLRIEYQTWLDRNTKMLEDLASLSRKKAELEQMLEVSQQSVVAEYSGSLRKEKDEEKKLEDTVRAQGDDIEKMRRQISQLRKKGYRPSFSDFQLPNTMPG
ncbi:hypothetical protein PROFUN_07282 [Planoprotostelium fungivorum]|uniref:EML-like first beta-propeller domain-containing protein n=1 Tax=Planoprotostelium fungivorum TaxID=1890364 RepID=A0A2P6NM02_9EUKA|nr:hypothetical protein PROFUN_07282 [Planoprotostelium fungivorum]